MNEFCSIAAGVKLGNGVKLSKFINLHGRQLNQKAAQGQDEQNGRMT